MKTLNTLITILALVIATEVNASFDRVGNGNDGLAIQLGQTTRPSPSLAGLSNLERVKYYFDRGVVLTPDDLIQMSGKELVGASYSPNINRHPNMPAESATKIEGLTFDANAPLFGELSDTAGFFVTARTYNTMSRTHYALSDDGRSTVLNFQIHSAYMMSPYTFRKFISTTGNMMILGLRRWDLVRFKNDQNPRELWSCSSASGGHSTSSTPTEESICEAIILRVK